MNTLDGFILKEGDSCWIACQCPMGEHNIGTKPRKAAYLDEIAKRRGFDFTLNSLRTECDPEIVAVWKNKPIKRRSNHGST